MQAARLLKNFPVFLFFVFLLLICYIIDTVARELELAMTDVNQGRIKGTEKAPPIHTLFHR